MLALGETKKNQSSLEKQLKKVASGMKINSAGDGAAEYAISEKMQVRIRSLGQNDENVTASESVIRDSDMAKEMSEYTKHNVLTQAAQAMLAQANQNSSGILSLLQ